MPSRPCWLAASLPSSPSFALVIRVGRLLHRLIDASLRRQVSARPLHDVARRIAFPHIVREVARVELALVRPGVRVAIVLARPRLHCGDRRDRLRRFRLHNRLHDRRRLRLHGSRLLLRRSRLHNRRLRDLRRLQRLRLSRRLRRRAQLLRLRRLRLQRLLRLDFGRRRLLGLLDALRLRLLRLLHLLGRRRRRLLGRLRRDLLRHRRANDRHRLHGRNRLHVRLLRIERLHERLVEMRRRRALLPLLGERHRVLVAHLNALRRLLRDRSLEDVGAVVQDGRWELLHHDRLRAVLVRRRRRDRERLPSVLVDVVLDVLDPRVVQLQLRGARALGHAARLRLLGRRLALRDREARLERLEEVSDLHLLELLRQLLDLLVLDFRGHACLLACVLQILLPRRRLFTKGVGAFNFFSNLIGLA